MDQLDEHEQMEQETARIRAFKGKVRILKCGSCGHEFETDQELAQATALPCSRCGATKRWTVG